MEKTRKVKKLAVCALSFLLALGTGASLTACDSGGNASGGADSSGGLSSSSGGAVLPADEKETFTVTFASESGTVYGAQTVEEGKKATLPEYTDRYGNAITQWYYKYANGATEYWSFAGYPVTEDMTLYAVESDGATGTTYELEATFSAFIDAMGGVEFGAGIYQGATITVLSEEEQRYLLTMQTAKSSVTIYGVTCDTFIDPAATSATGESEVPPGTIGYYDAEGNLVTDGVSYTLSDEGDTAYAPDPEGGSNYVSVRYVTEIGMVLENVGALADLDELEITFFINSQVMGGQFCNSETSSTRSAARLTISGMTEIEREPETPETPVIGIADAEIDENGHLILTLSDGSQLDAGLVKGEDGGQGVGISRIEYDAPLLHIYLTDGTHYRFDLSGTGGSDLPDNVTETHASCTQDGVRTTYTDASKTEVLGIRTIERATGHTYENGACTVCGREQIDDMTFAENESGYTLTAYNSHAWDTVAIPDAYNGRPVTAIADGETMMGLVLSSGVFMNHAEIETVLHGAGLTAVGLGAFSGCTSLSSFDFSGIAEVGKWAFQNCALVSVSLDAAVEAIADNAFYGNAALGSVSLPSGLTSIGGSAFYGCASLTEIDIPDGVTSIGNSAFMNSGLLSVSVPASVTTLGTGVFGNCTALESAAIYAPVTTLPNTTFSGCTSLTRVNSETEGTFDLTAYTAIGNSACMNSGAVHVLFSPSLTSAGSSAFDGCTDLVSVDFGNNTGAVSFGTQAFRGCTSLESIALPDNSTLGSTMFSGCTSLADVTLGDAVSQIPANCFQDCVSLTKIAVPDSVAEIGTNAFNDCTALEEISFGENSGLVALRGISGCSSLTCLTIPAGVETISACTGNYFLIEIVNLSGIELAAGSTDNGSIAQYAKNIVTSVPESGYVTGGDYTLYRDGNAAGEKWYVTAYNGAVGSDGEVAFPESFTVGDTTVSNYEIYNRIFYGNDAVKSVFVPAGMTAIGAYAFAGCENLSSVTFAEGSSLASIANNAFAGCVSLTSINLPDSLLSIGGSAFSGCTALASVGLGGVRNIGASAFGNCYALQSIELPASATDIDGSAFSGCTLAEVVNPGGLENIPAAASVVIDAADSRLVTSGDFTFLYIPAEGETPAQAYLVSYGGASGSVTLPSGFTAGEVRVDSYEIFAGAFAERTFNMITIPAAVTAVGSYAFYNTSVIGISFEDASKCAEIASYAFAGCTAMYFNSSMSDADGAYLLNLDGFSVVGEYAFTQTTRLQKLFVGASVTEIGGRAFAYSAIRTIGFAEERAEALTLASYAFAYMTSLQSVAAPGHVTALPPYLFRCCTRLASVSLSEGVESIANYVFRDCSSLTSLVLPGSLTSFASSAFGYSSVGAYYLAGTEADAEGVSYPSAVANALYYYSEKDPISDGNYWHYDESGNIAVWEMV